MKSTTNRVIDIKRWEYNTCIYADDIVIIGKTQEVKKSMMEKMKTGESIGLNVIMEK